MGFSRRPDPFLHPHRTRALISPNRRQPARADSPTEPPSTRTRRLALPATPPSTRARRSPRTAILIHAPPGPMTRPSRSTPARIISSSPSLQSGLGPSCILRKPDSLLSAIPRMGFRPTFSPFRAGRTAFGTRASSSMRAFRTCAPPSFDFLKEIMSKAA